MISVMLDQGIPQECDVSPGTPQECEPFLSAAETLINEKAVAIDDSHRYARICHCAFVHCTRDFKD